MAKSTTTELWDAICETPPDQTKPITGRPYSGTSPKPYWLVRRATEVFGPCGIGWGYEILDEKLMDGAMLDPAFYEQIHFARVRVWYEWNGKRGEVEHVGQTLFSGRRKNGATFTDEDAPKKSVTDALIKALSMIGFAGDIFMGRYDDAKYVESLKTESKANSRELYTQLETEIRTVGNSTALEKWGVANKERIRELHPDFQTSIRGEYKRRLDELKAEQPSTT